MTHIRTILNYAQRGSRIIAFPVDGKETKIYSGVGNQSGLYSYAATERERKYLNNKTRILNRLKNFKGFIVIQDYRNITRDRGRWQIVDRFGIK